MIQNHEHKRGRKNFKMSLMKHHRRSSLNLKSHVQPPSPTVAVELVTSTLTPTSTPNITSVPTENTINNVNPILPLDKISQDPAHPILEQTYMSAENQLMTMATLTEKLTLSNKLLLQTVTRQNETLTIHERLHKIETTLSDIIERLTKLEKNGNAN